MALVGPTVGDGTVYVGNGDGVVFAFGADGERQWRTDVGGSVESSVALGAEYGYVVVRDTETDVVELVALDRAGGDVAWRYELTSDRPYSALRGQPVVADGTVYASGDTFGPEVEPRRFLVAVADGSERWRVDVGSDGLTSPSVADERVVVGAYDPDGEAGRVLAVDRADGSVVWETPLSTQPARAPAIVDGEVYVPTWTDVTVLDAGDGTVLRTLDVAAGSEPIAVADGTVYAVADDRLVAVNATTGARRWTAGESFVDTPPVVAANAVVVGADGAVVGLDPETGQRQWAYVVDERVGVRAHPAVVDGAVYVGPTNRRLYSLVEGGSAVPGGLAGQVGHAILSDTLLGTLAALAAASLVAGLLAGTVTLGLARLRGYSWAPPRVVASRVLRRPYADTGRLAAAAVHVVLAVVVPFVLGALFLGVSIAVPALGLPAVPLLGGGLVYVGALLVLTAAGGWALLTSRWLPAAASAADVELGRLRRQAAVVVGTYAVVTGLVYPLLLFLAMMLVFFR